MRRPRQKGTGSLTAKAVAAERRAAEMEIVGHVECEKDPLDWLASFVYLGNKSSADADPLVPVKHRIVQASTAFTQGRTVFTSEKSIALRFRLYKSGVNSVLRYGSETYTLIEQASNALKSFNARSLARITGRKIADEYHTPSYDLVHEIRKTRARWLGHILRTDQNSPGRSRTSTTTTTPARWSAPRRTTTAPS